MNEQFQIITFYKFIGLEGLEDLRGRLREEVRSRGIKGTIILAAEGVNATVCGKVEMIGEFIGTIKELFGENLNIKSSYHAEMPFRRSEVKIKPEIVTLKRAVDVRLGVGTHVSPTEWNKIISDPETLVLDTRNSYEYRTGTFERAIDPGTEKFSELPDFVSKHLVPEKHKRVAMFCSGGIRCEKFAAYLKQTGFKDVFQLEGGILKYLEEIPPEENLWRGECFVFDSRVSVDAELRKGKSVDLSTQADG
jgi:UPF0176 protein